MRGYLPLIRKDSSTHMHVLAVYVKEGLPFARDLSVENSADSYVFNWLYFTHCLTSFSSINHLLLCAWFFILFYLTQMRFSLSTPLLMHLSLETLMPIVKTGLHILVELIVFCSTLAFPPFENSDHVVVSVSIDFPSY